MTETDDKAKRGIVIEQVAAGDKVSRISSAAFLLIAAIPVIATILFGGVDNSTWILLDVLTFAIIGLWLTESWRGGGLLIETNTLMLPVAGLIAVGLIQLLPLAGADPLTGSASTISTDQYATRFFITKLVVYAAFFAAALTFINTEKRMRTVVTGIVLFGALTAFFGILQRLANPDGIYGVRGTPQAMPFGPFVNQHHFAAFMQMCSGLAFAFLFGGAIKRDRKIMVLIAVGIMGVAAAFTGSRGGLLGFTAAILFASAASLLLFRKHNDEAKGGRRFILAAAGAAALLLVIFAAAMFLGGGEGVLRGTGIANADADLSSGRTRFWAAAIKIFLAHPLIGAGFEAFGAAFTRYDTGSGLFRVEQAHNDYLQTLADAGILGFALVAAFIWLLFKNGLARASESTDDFRRTASIGALAGCFGILVHSFFDFPLRTPSNAFFFLLLCTVATGAATLKAKSRRRRSRSASAA